MTDEGKATMTHESQTGGQYGVDLLRIIAMRAC